MKIHKTFIAVGMIVAFTMFFELAAHADEGDQATEITFSQPIQIPGQVLPAGTYLFKLADPDDLNIVQIFNSDRTHIYATLKTLPTENRELTGDTSVALADQGIGKPELMLKWFYPGDETGHEFVYSNQLRNDIALDERQMSIGKQQAITGFEAAGSN